MRNRKADMPTLKVKNIAHYIEGNKSMNNHTFVATSSGNFYSVGGIRIEAEIFERNFPPMQLQKAGIHKGKQLDGRSNWID